MVKPALYFPVIPFEMEVASSEDKLPISQHSHVFL
jgi:hypothetical protein